MVDLDFSVLRKVIENFYRQIDQQINIFKTSWEAIDDYIYCYLQHVD